MPNKMDDLINRADLIAVLETFKQSQADVILGYVVDRVIECVKAQQAVKLPRMEMLSDRIVFYISPDEEKTVMLKNL